MDASAIDDTGQHCQAIIEVWGPHEGCREFMSEPESFPCGGEAAALLTLSCDGTITTEFLCGEHAASTRQTAADQGIEIISYSPAPGH
jgi:hypothetical protein